MAITRSFSTLALASALGWTVPAHAQAERIWFNASGAEVAANSAIAVAVAQHNGGAEGHEGSPEVESEVGPRDDRNDASADAASAQIAPPAEQDSGWTFEPFGRLMIDAGSVDAPAGIDEPGLGFDATVRRARLGAEGDIPGGFDYKLELEFSGENVEITDAILGYDSGDAKLTAGQHNNFQGLEELTSSRFLSFMERAAFTDAFGFQRRVGLSASYERETLLVQGGVFTASIDDLDVGNNSRGADVRALVAPKLGDVQLHVGASVHFRDIRGTQTAVRYRQRPQVNFTDIRFVSTGDIGVESELGYGLEFAAIKGPLHVTGETFWQRVDRPGALADPTFFGGYAEVGYFLTRGDSRGYKGKKFDRVEPENPVGKGGFGALQITARYDYLDLSEAGIIGGTQNSYGLSLVWTPTDHTRLMANYWRSEYRGAAITAGTISDYGVDSFGVRAQFDF